MRKFYQIFEKNEIKNYVESLWKDKPSLSWIASFTSVITLITSFLTLDYTKFSTHQTEVQHIILLFIFIFIIYGGFSFFKWIKYSGKISDIEKELEKKSISQDYTCLFLIKHVMDSKSYILVETHKLSGYWLPYIKINKDSHDEDINEDDLDNISKKLQNKFKSKVEISDLKLDLEDVLKEKPGKGYSKISYSFFEVELKIDYLSFKENILDKNKKLYKFVTLDEMKEDIITLKTNFDVISHLEHLGINNLDDAFQDSKLIDKLFNLKVIWNITKKCQHNCSFCATDSSSKNTEELTFKQRIKILEELMKVPSLRLDIAGGDPFFDSDVTDFLEHISKYMTSDYTVTTTGEAINKYSQGNISKIQAITNEYDISYDYPSYWNDTHRGNNHKYNQVNHNYIKTLSDNGLDVNVLITVSDHNTKDYAIEKMIEEVNEIKPHSITLLRLMPVGRQAYATYPPLDNKYNPLEVIKRFQKEFKNVKLHCAYRAHLEKKEQCNMLKDKIGVDNMGNVFSCAWAGYIDISLDENPFYLGNLLKETMDQIVNSERYMKLVSILENNKINYCPIFSYLENKDKLFEENNDNFTALLAK